VGRLHRPACDWVDGLLRVATPAIRLVATVKQNPSAGGLRRAVLPLWRAAAKSRRLAKNWDSVDLIDRRRRLDEITRELETATSLVRSATMVARHRGEA
jgi:hypothetical protein